MQGQKIGTVGLTEKEAAIRQYIETCYAMKHQNISADEIGIEASNIENSVSHSFAHLTLGEVRLALEAGIVGEFGSNQANPANFLTWITAYNKCADRATACEILARRQSARDAAMAHYIDREEEERRNAENYKVEPGRAFNCYKAEGRNGFLFPQNLSRNVYKPLRPQIAEWMQGLPDKKERLAAFKADALAMLKEKFKQSWKVSGENALVFDDCYKAEIVFGYFDYLISKGATI